MSQNLINIPQGFAGALPSVFQGVGGADELSAGVTGGFGIITYKGKVWRTKYRGEETVLFAADGRNARPELEVVIVRAAPVISKVYYQEGFVEGSSAPPDCWSVNGLVPDAAAPKKQSNTCAGCPQNAWGSRISDAGKAGKACSDNKRLAIVPADDIRNESLGGPMMLRVPPASLQDMAQFGKMMEAKGFPYYSFVTRLRFDPNEAYPKFVFEPVRPLTDDEAKLVIEMRDNPITQRILEAPVVEVQHDTELPGQPKAEDLFGAAAAAKAAQMAAQVTGQPQGVVVAQPATVTVTQPQTTAVPQTVVPPQTADARNPARPLFDPMTGQKIIYADEDLTIPAALVRNKPATQPVVAQPTQPVQALPEDAPIKDFDDALNNLLGGGKK